MTGFRTVIRYFMLAIAPASYALFLLAYVVPIALGNTEIVNFDAVFAEDRHEPPSHWYVHMHRTVCISYPHTTA